MAKKIGDVYVRVHFSSDGKELKEQVKGDKGFEEAGQEAGDKYNDGWIKELEKGVKDTDLVEKRRGAAIKGQTTKTTNAIGKLWEKFYADQTDNAEKLRHSVDDIDNTWQKMLVDFKDAEGESSRLRQRFDSLATSLRTRLGGAWDRLGLLMLRFDRISGRVAGGFNKVWGGTIGFLGRLTARAGRDLDVLGNKVGTAFGKGGRNDFINIFGRSMQGIVEVTARAFTGFSKLFGLMSGEGLNAFAKTGEAVGKAAEESATLGEAAGGAATSLSSLAAAAPVAAVVAVALAAAIGLASSAIMLLTGAVIALAAALSFALIGAIGAVAGALVPLVAGIGVTVIAFQNMDKATKKAFGGIKDEFTDLGKVAAKGLFANAAQDARKLGHVLEGLRPLVRVVARAMGGVLDNLVKGLDSPQFKQFEAFLVRVLPGMVAQIGRIAGNVGQGLANLFIAVTPLVQEFLGWLEGVTQSFADLGKGGTSSRLSKFFRDLQPTMDSVGAAIGQIIGLIFDLFQGPGQRQGGKMFQSLADNVRKFRDFLLKAKRDGSLAQFFRDARKLANQIGNAVVQIGKFIAALDTPRNRSMIIGLFKAFNKVVEVLIFLARVQQRVDRLWGQIGHAAVVAFNFVKTAATNAAQWVQQKWNALVSWFGNLGHRLTTAAAWASIGRTIGETVFQAIIGALTGLPGQIVNLFTGLGSRIVSAIGSIVPHINWPDPPGWLKKVVPGMATGGIVLGPTIAKIGEAGAEAIVPLNRPLSQVDPAVRALSAIAQGKADTATLTGRGGRSITTGPITIITPTKDPRAVAAQVVNRIAAASYI